MTPGLHDGDLALIDQRRNTVRSGQVYALTDIDGSTRVKRVDVLPTGLILRSDAPSYPTEFRPCDDANRVNIIGQVVWSGHTW
ncbi:peptidase S24-like protein [Rhodobacter maris]|uniref:Peptidase S24-like protein n=2 Tax=Rhodobacter maris TaxID=446682 RepID=A0A285TDB4_9RHOB|nr:peptidase S24-like protein [Rhodobacter maris]